MNLMNLTTLALLTLLQTCKDIIILFGVCVCVCVCVNENHSCAY